MSQRPYVESRPDMLTLGGVGGETGNIGKRLEWSNRDETWWVEQANVVDT